MIVLEYSRLKCVVNSELFGEEQITADKALHCWWRTWADNALDKGTALQNDVSQRSAAACFENNWG